MANSDSSRLSYRKILLKGTTLNVSRLACYAYLGFVDITFYVGLNWAGGYTGYVAFLVDDIFAEEFAQ